MKKLSVSFIVLLMIISSFSLTSFAKGESKTSIANDAPKVSVSKVTAQPQSEVLVPIKLSNNNKKGLWGMVFSVYYDTDVFKLKEVVNNGDVFNNADFMIGPSDLNDGYVLVEITPSNITENNTSNGTICSLKLNVAKNAKFKKYDFRIVINDACDVQAKDVQVNGYDGSVTVQKSADNIAQKESDNNSTDKNGKADKTETVVGRAENNKIVQEEAYYNDSSSSNNKSEDETNGAQDSDKTDDNIKNDNSSKDTNEETKDIKKIDNDSQDTASGKASLTFMYIYVAALAVIAVIVIIVALVVKRKKK